MKGPKLIALVVVVFVGFWLFTDPRGLAAFATDGGDFIWDITETLFTNTIAFLGELF